MHKHLITALRIVASALMLGYLLTKIDVDPAKVVPEWTTGRALWLVGAVVLTLLGFVLSALRWQQVLAALGLRSRTRRLLSHYLAGQFVANVLPTTIGGDVLRVTRLARDNGESQPSFASVVLERLTGWLVLPVLTLVGFLVNPGLTHLGAATQVALGIAGATLVALVLIVVVVADERLGGRLAAKQGWQRFGGAVHLGLAHLRHHPSAAAGILAVGFLYQLVLVLAALAAAHAVGMEQVGPTALLAFFPAVAIAQVLPLSISGVGIREGAFVLFLTPLGVPAEQAIALGLLLYLLNVLVSLLGAPAFAIGGRRLTDAEVVPSAAA
ncbi:lysylphosphatidylglycerol synthase transmembrane domain-containing protein [soil metagenome]